MMSSTISDRRLLDALAGSLSRFSPARPEEQFSELLDLLLDLTASEYGFIGEVLRKPGGEPYLRTHAITDISWNAETAEFYRQYNAVGLEFTNLDTLFGHTLRTGRKVIANDPGNDPRRGGLPAGHPSLDAFLGLPIRSAGEMVGMVGVANRPGGYDDELVSRLEPFLLTCGSFIRLVRAETVKREVTQKLEESEARSRSILEVSPDAIITIDESGKILAVNPAAQSLFGYRPQQLIGRNVRVLIPEPHRSRHDGYISRYIKTGDARVIGTGREVIALRKNGEEFPVALSIAELKVQGRRMFTGSVRDISRRVEAQKHLESAMEQLRESKQDLLSILNQTRLGVLMIDRAGKVRFASAACEELLRSDIASMTGQRWEKICPLQELDKRAVAKQLAALPNDRVRTRARLELGGRGLWIEIEIRDDPRDPHNRIILVENVTELQSLRTRLSTESRRRMIGKSDAFRQMLDQVDRYSAGDWPVLVEGETGTGKELVARAVHSLSDRNGGPFIAVNCGGMTETLLTSHLFGHKRGAFTDAVSDHEGLFEAAAGGTLFLDEISELPLNSQATLLRVLQEGEITRLGESQPRKVDVRIISATNRELESEVGKGNFRRDLFYRICVARIHAPPLRERRSDIRILVEHFLEGLQQMKGSRVDGVSPGALKLLENYTWPGNIRELRNVIQTSVIHCKTAWLEADALPDAIRRSGSFSGKAAAGDAIPDDDLRARIADALARADGNRRLAAELLGVSRATLYRHMRDVGIGPKHSKRR